MKFVELMVVIILRVFAGKNFSRNNDTTYHTATLWQLRGGTIKIPPGHQHPVMTHVVAY